MANSKVPRPEVAVAPEDWDYLEGYLKLTKTTAAKIVTDQASFLPEDLRSLASDAIRGKVGKSHHEALVAFTKAISYDGFNPQTIIHELVLKAKKANEPKPAEGTYNFELDGQVYSITHAANIAKDCHMLIALFLVRGNNLFKIMKTISKDAKIAINAKMI